MTDRKKRVMELMDSCGGGVIPHKKISRAIEAAMRSERELCAKELEAEACGDDEEVYKEAAQFSRDGGK